MQKGGWVSGREATISATSTQPNLAREEEDNKAKVINGEIMRGQGRSLEC